MLVNLISLAGMLRWDNENKALYPGMQGESQEWQVPGLQQQQSHCHTKAPRQENAQKGASMEVLSPSPLPPHPTPHASLLASRGSLLMEEGSLLGAELPGKGQRMVDGGAVGARRHAGTLPFPFYSCS